MRLLFIILFLFAWSANATTYYISPSGNDATGTGAIGNPWQTLYKACTSVTTTGDIIHVNAGTYTETSQCLLSVGVSIEGDGITSILKNNITTDWISLLLLSSASEATDGNQHISNVKFDGQFTTGATGSAVGIEVIGRKNVSIHDITMVDFRMRGIIFAGRTDNTDAAPTTYATGNTIYNCTITNCAEFNHPLTAGFGCVNIGGQEGMTIHDNVISQDSRPNGYNGWPIKYYNGGYLRALRIYNNTLNKILNYTYLGGDNWDFAIELFRESGLEIDHNTINGGSIDINYQTKGGYAYAAWLHDNIISMPSQNTYTQTGITVEVDNDGVIIERNVIDKVSVGILFTPRLGNVIKNITIRNNLITNIGLAEGAGAAINFGGTTNNYFDSIDIYNNTLLESSTSPTWFGIILPSNTTSGYSKNINIKNNIMNGAVTSAVVIESSTVATDFLNISYNDFYNNGTDSLVLNGGAATPTNYTSTNLLHVNPYFGTSGYKLVAGSTLVDAGTNVGLPYIGTAPDINWTDTTAAAPVIPCGTWDSVHTGPWWVRTNSNKTITTAFIATATSAIAFGTPMNTGKVAFSMRINSMPPTKWNMLIGMANSSQSLTGIAGDNANAYMIEGGGVLKHSGYYNNTYTGDLAVGDTLTFATDFTGATGTQTIYKNRVSLGTAFTLIDTSQLWYPCVSLQGDSGDWGIELITNSFLPSGYSQVCTNIIQHTFQIRKPIRYSN